MVQIGVLARPVLAPGPHIWHPWCKACNVASIYACVTCSSSGYGAGLQWGAVPCDFNVSAVNPDKQECNLEWKAPCLFVPLRLWLQICLSEPQVSHLCLGSCVTFVSVWVWVCAPLSSPSLVSEAWGKRCHNFNTRPCWIHKIITHTCHLFVMILSLLTYLHIKALIKISEESNAYFKTNSEGDPCTASRDVLFLFALFVCCFGGVVCCLHSLVWCLLTVSSG